MKVPRRQDTQEQDTPKDYEYFKQRYIAEQVRRRLEQNAADTYKAPWTVEPQQEQIPKRPRKPTKDDIHSELVRRYHPNATPVVGNDDVVIYRVEPDWMWNRPHVHRELVYLFQFLYDLA